MARSFQARSFHNIVRTFTSKNPRTHNLRRRMTQSSSKCVCSRSSTQKQARYTYAYLVLLKHERKRALPICISCSLSYKAKTSALDIEFYTENTLHTHLHHYFYCLERSSYIVERYNLASYADVSPSMKICAQRRAERRKRGRRASSLIFLLPVFEEFPCPSSSVSRVSVAFRARLCVKTKHLRKRQLTAYVRKLSCFYLQISSAHIHELRTGFSEEFALKNINKLYSFVWIQFPDVTFIHNIFVRLQLWKRAQRIKSVVYVIFMPSLKGWFPNNPVSLSGVLLGEPQDRFWGWGRGGGGMVIRICQQKQRETNNEKPPFKMDCG